MASLTKMTLIDKIKTREANVVVIGLGYVGLPLAVEKAKAEFSVVGIERNPERVRKVNEGENYIPDVLGLDFDDAVRTGKLRATQEFDVIADADIITICVPTPIDKNKNPDITYVVDVVNRALPYLKREQLMVIESTTYPGMTQEVVLPLIESQGFTLGEDYYLAYSPERVDPGNLQYRLKNTPKVVGGHTAKCGEVAAAFYETIIQDGVMRVSSPRVAEMTKLLENVFRVVNVSLVNELAILCDRMGIDIWEVIEAAKTKPFGFMPFYPGPGIGGHCIPIDPFYLAWKAREYNFDTRFIQLAGDINDSMPDYVVNRSAEIVNKFGKCLNGARVLLLGVAYKRDIDDLRESSSVKVGSILQKWGAELAYHDPFVPACTIGDRQLKSITLDPAALASFELTVIATDHSNVDYEMVAKHAPLIFDTRNVLSGLRAPHIFTLGAPTASE